MLKVRKYLKKNIKFMLNLKINGFQHLSQMTQDTNTNLAKYVNIIKSNKDDVPE